jgi:23S rRNA (guanosine2251-2'-O)-methyltransferase
MNVVRVTNLNRTLEELKSRGLWIVGATMEGEDVSEANLTGPLALVIGAEGEGISQLVEKNCDMKVSLPMRGHIESLNASVAAGVLLYAVLDARRR